MPSTRIIIVVLISEVLVFAGIFSFPALVPTFIEQWNLTYTQAGWVSGIYFAGYVVSVLVIVRMTEYIDARLVFMVSAALMSAAWLGFAYFAQGFWSALAFRFLAGIGFAGTYMPGLRSMLDRVKPVQSRLVVTLYMAGATLGSGVSFLLAGEVGNNFGWNGVFLAASAAAFVAMLLVGVFLQPVAKPPRQPSSVLAGVLGVFRNRRALGFVLAYGAHNWEVYTMNSWVVALLVFNLATGDATQPWLAPTTVGTAIGILAIPTILGGGALATRFGDRRVVSLAMVLSAIGACVVGALVSAPYSVLVALLLIYSVLVYADSPGLTSGAILSANTGQTGDVMALHTLVGHLTAAVGPPAFGLVLDLTGGGTRTHSWAIAFACVAAVVVLGPICLRATGSRRK